MQGKACTTLTEPSDEAVGQLKILLNLDAVKTLTKTYKLRFLFTILICVFP
jgi:hypothetical protein